MSLYSSVFTSGVEEPLRAASAENACSDCATMARAANYDLLAYFLEMARIEANVQVEQQSQK